MFGLDDCSLRGTRDRQIAGLGFAGDSTLRGARDRQIAGLGVGGHCSLRDAMDKQMVGENCSVCDGERCTSMMAHNVV